MVLVLAITTFMLTLGDWLVRHAIELLWMLTVLGTASVLLSGLETIAKELTAAITAVLTEGARTREEQAQRRDLRRAVLRQDHWRIRHHHTHP
jgi:predicted DNA repair protein MutK